MDKGCDICNKFWWMQINRKSLESFLCVNCDTVTYFDSFEVEHIVKNTYRIQAFDSMMCGHFCIGLIDFMFEGKTLFDYTN